MKYFKNSNHFFENLTNETFSNNTHNELDNVIEFNTFFEKKRISLDNGPELFLINNKVFSATLLSFDGFYKLEVFGNSIDIPKNWSIFSNHYDQEFCLIEKLSDESNLCSILSPFGEEMEGIIIFFKKEHARIYFLTDKEVLTNFKNSFFFIKNIA